VETGLRHEEGIKALNFGFWEDLVSGSALNGLNPEAVLKECGPLAASETR
jgi:hypothetical protein